MPPERLSPRKVADRILCLQLEQGNQAIVQNISDEGLGFHALKPVTQSGTIQFTYLENGSQNEASGELVWLDSTKMNGGLSFARLPRSSRARIRNWVDQAMAGRIGPEPAPPQSQNSSPIGIGTVEPTKGPVRSTPPLGASIPEPDTPYRFALVDNDPQRLGYTWNQDMSKPYSRMRFFRGFLTGMIITALAGVGLLLVYGDQAGPLISQGRVLIGMSPIPPPPPFTPPAAATPPPAAAPPPLLPSASPPSNSTQAPAAASSSVPGAAAESKANDVPVQPASIIPPADNHVPKAPASALPKTAEPGESDFAVAQHYLNQKTGPVGNAVAVRFLWSAVEKGNVDAEVTLADLYARGDGVGKSCDQATVLLRAAAEKGSADASQKLAQVVRSGCR